MLVKVYKALIRWVLDYSNVISAACTKRVKDDLEVIQNNALRIIYKRSIMDHVEVESLRDWAGVKQIKVRLNELLNSYYEKALTSHNPLLIKLFEEYKVFKKRKCIGEELAVGRDRVVDLEKLELIRKNNFDALNKEIHPTTLCRADKVIRDLLIDNYDPGPVGSGIR